MTYACYEVALRFPKAMPTSLVSQPRVLLGLSTSYSRLTKNLPTISQYVAQKLLKKVKLLFVTMVAQTFFG